MPATHLISVDLPAPLSPTSAITSPLRTSRSTSVSAWTEPNDLETPRSSSRGTSDTAAPLIPQKQRRRPMGASAFVPSAASRLAVFLVLAAADVARLQEAALHEKTPVR